MAQERKIQVSQANQEQESQEASRTFQINRLKKTNKRCQHRKYLSITSSSIQTRVLQITTKLRDSCTLEIFQMA